MLQSYLNRDGKLNSKAQENLIACERGYQKLSNFYNSRTTTYASVLNSDLFIRITNKEEIIQKGFDCRVKCIISANYSNTHVIDFFNELNIQREKQKESELEAERIFKSQVKSCKIEILNDERFQKYIKNQREKGSSERTIAWKLTSSTIKPNLSKYKVKVIYNSIYDL